MGCWLSKPPSKPEATRRLTSAKSVAVVGGGLAGLSSAYYLARKGLRVEVFERNMQLAKEASYGPAGVTMWKPVKRGLKWTVDLTAGGVRGGLVFAEGMAWNAIHEDPRRQVIMQRARAVHHQFARDEPAAQDILHTEGLLYVLDEEYFVRNRQLFANDYSMQFLTKAEFEQSEFFSPLFEDCNYYGVLLSREEGAIDPHRLVRYMAMRVEAMGGHVHLGCDVERLEEIQAGVVVHVRGKAPKKLDGCVLAIGATTHPGALLRRSGFQDNVPEIYGVKGYTITGRVPKGTLKMGFVDATDTKFIRPFLDLQGNYCIRAGGLADPFEAQDPLDIKWDRLEEFKNNQFLRKVFASNELPGPGGKRADTSYDCIVEEGKLEVWTGIRPVNKFGRVPLFRWVRGSQRVLVVSGFGSNGFVMCWHAGPRVAELFGVPRKETE